MAKVYELTLAQYNKIHKDYRGVLENEKNPALNGKKAAFEGSIRGALGLPAAATPCALIFEGIHFRIINDCDTCHGTGRVHLCDGRAQDGEQVVIDCPDCNHA